MTGNAWFRPKNYGYGATPINWKGWLFIAVMVLILWALGGLFLKPVHHWPAFAIGFALWLTVVIGVSKWKTEGEWRWRWNGIDGR